MKLKVILAVILGGLLFGCYGPEPPSQEPIAKYERVGGQGIFHFIFVKDSPTIDRSTYRRIAKTICRGERICIVMFWKDRTKVPYSLPMTDAQVNAKVAHYNLNKNTGLDRVLICAVDGC